MLHHPYVLQYLFPPNNNILLRNPNKVKKLMLIHYYCLSSTHSSCPNKVETSCLKVIYRKMIQFRIMDGN